MKLESSYLILYKWINAINVKSNNAKLLGKKTDNPYDLGERKETKGINPKGKEMNKFDYI